MFATVMIAVFILAGTALFWVGPVLSKDSVDGPTISRLGGVIVGAVGWIWLGFACVEIVDDGKVGVTKAFGQFGDETLSPGFNIIMPWESVEQVDTRVKSYTFSSDEDESISGPISAQADGGGNLTIEHTVQVRVDKATADDLLREVGSNWFDIVVLPAIRSCTRDATTNLTLEEAYTTERASIGINTQECVSEKVNHYGISINDVLIRDVDPGEKVKNAIDIKQEQEQQLQQAAIKLEQERISAQQEAVKAFGVSNAERIISCGGREIIEDGVVVNVLANEECEDQFSEEYLQWLYINQLSDIDGVVILPPEFNGNLFVQTPSGNSAPSDN